MPLLQVEISPVHKVSPASRMKKNANNMSGSFVILTYIYSELPGRISDLIFSCFSMLV